MSAEQHRQAITMYREGANTQEVAVFFGVSREAIRKLLRTRGVKVRPRHKPPINGTNHTSEGLGYSNPTNEERNEWGVIVTLRRQSDDELRSLHVAGKRLDALRHVAALIDASGDDWRVVSYSTPPTILSDMQAKRMRRGNRERDMDRYQSIEAAMLSQIGRLDLLDPSVRAHPDT